MSRESDEGAIHKEYAGYLDGAGVPYRNSRNGFHVYIKVY